MFTKWLVFKATLIHGCVQMFGRGIFRYLTTQPMRFLKRVEESLVRDKISCTQLLQWNPLTRLNLLQFPLDLIKKFSRDSKSPLWLQTKSARRRNRVDLRSRPEETTVATHCNFGANLIEDIREKLISGLKIVQIQKRLLSKAKLKYSKALEIAVAIEIAIRGASILQSGLHDKISVNSKPLQLPPPPPNPPDGFRLMGWEQTRSFSKRRFLIADMTLTRTTYTSQQRK